MERQKNAYTVLDVKYGRRIKERAAHCDRVGYHPNDRRRSIVIEPQDFDIAQKNEILFIHGIRLTDENHNSAVK